MAITVTDARQIMDEADSATGWTASASVTAANAPAAVEATNQLGMAVSTSTDYAYTGITSYNMSGGVLIYVWMQANGDMDTLSNGGIQICLGDGTDLIGYHVGGSDKGAWRVEDGPVAWQLFVLDTANLPANTTQHIGAAAVNLSAVTQIGVAYKTLSKALGGSTNCYWDIIRVADPGEGIRVYGGTSPSPETFATVATSNRAVGNQQAHGLVRELGAGVYGIQGNFGWDASSNDVYFLIDTETVAWEDRSFSSTNYYRLDFLAAAVQNAELEILNSTLSVPSTASADMDLSDPDIDLCTVTGSTIIGFDQGIATAHAGDDWTGNTFIDNGQITHNGCDLSGSAIEGYNGTAGTAALVYNEAVDPDGELDNMMFTKGIGTCHAIELGSSTPASITLRGWEVSGYSAANGNNDSVIYNNSGKAITVNVIGNTGTISYRNGASATTTIVANPVTLNVTAQDAGGTKIQSARCHVVAGDTVGGLPHQDSVTITRVVGDAIVAHTAHGFTEGQWVLIEGADQAEYNGSKQISAVNSANEYEFEVTGSPTTPATGTITATAVIIHEQTTVAGLADDTRTYAVDQLIDSSRSWLRKGSSADNPKYKTAPIAGTIDSATGLSLTVQMIEDE